MTFKIKNTKIQGKKYRIKSLELVEAGHKGYFIADKKTGKKVAPFLSEFYYLKDAKEKMKKLERKS
jgi:hypothetical protein